MLNNHHFKQLPLIAVAEKNTRMSEVLAEIQYLLRHALLVLREGKRAASTQPKAMVKFVKSVTVAILQNQNPW